MLVRIRFTGELHGQVKHCVVFTSQLIGFIHEEENQREMRVCTAKIIKLFKLHVGHNLPAAYENTSAINLLIFARIKIPIYHTAKKKI